MQIPELGAAAGCPGRAALAERPKIATPRMSRQHISPRSYLAAEFHLRRYLAVCRMISPPRLAIEGEIKTQIAPSLPSQSTWTSRAVRRLRTVKNAVFSRSTGRMLLHLAAVYAFQAFLIFVLPKISTRLVLDLIFLGFIAFFQWASSGLALDTLIGSGKGCVERFKPEINRFHVVWKDADPDGEQRLRSWITHAFAVVFPTTMILAAFHGWAFVITFATSIMLYNLPWTYTFPRWSVRKVTRVILILEAVTVPLVWIFAAYMEKHHPGPLIDLDPKVNTRPSPWLYPLLTTYTAAFPSLFATSFLAMTYRFEYFQSNAKPARDSAEPVVVPSSGTIGSAPKPIFRAGLITHTALVLVFAYRRATLEGVGAFVVDDKPRCSGQDLIFACISMPAVVLACAGAAWRRGQLSAWWNHDEVWIPTPPPLANNAPIPSDKEKDPFAFDQEADMDKIETALDL